MMPHDRPRRLAFLPVVTKARELEARTLLAAHLVQRGFDVVLGRASAVNYRALHARGAVYFSPLLVPAAEPRLRALRAAGNAVIAWDEEGLVYPDPDWYFANRVSAASARHADALVAWGAIPARDLAATLPADIGTIHPFGNPRIDLLRAPFRRLYDAEGAALRERFGRYVLVNTNFDLVNHIDGADGLVRRLRAGGRIAGPHDEAKFAEWAVFRQAAFDAFRAGLPQLHAAVPGYTFVLRPHPSEDPAPYHALAEGLPRLIVAPPAGPVMPWLVGAEAVLHNSCTTAVEAFMLDTPVIAFHPAVAAGSMDSPLPNKLSRPAHSWDDVAALLNRLHDDGPADWVLPDQAAIADAYIGGRTGALSSERLADLALALSSRPATLGRPDPLAAARRLAGRMLRRIGLRQARGRDDAFRFPGLDLAEITALADRIAALRGQRLRVTRLAPDTYMIGDVA